MFSFKTALLFWLLASSVPLLSSLAYFCASPGAEAFAQRISVSLHGVAVSSLCIAAVLVGMVGTACPHLLDHFIFCRLCPSFLRFIP